MIPYYIQVLSFITGQQHKAMYQESQMNQKFVPHILENSVKDSVFMNHGMTQQIIAGCPITSLTKNKHTARRFQKIRTLLKK